MLWLLIDFGVLWDVCLPYWFLPACLSIWLGVGMGMVHSTLVPTGTSDAGVVLVLLLMLVIV
jgi:hypothetical protein